MPLLSTTINHLQGHDPAGLREFFSSLVKSTSGNTGVQILDRDGGAGWNLLACMLTNKSAERIRYSQLPILPWFLHIYIYPFGNLIYPFGTEQGLK
jgi:hypothetical protein